MGRFPSQKSRRAGNPKIVKFTRRDTRFTPPITNQKLTATSVECVTAANGMDFLTCIFQDEFGSRKSVGNIVFTNFEVRDPVINSYKDSQTSRLVQQVTFPRPTMCELMGQNHHGLTMKCSDASNPTKI